MQSSPSTQLRNLQALRFIAAALVVHAHSVDLAQRLGSPHPLLGPGVLENAGAFGVDVFFVISGFIIARTAGAATSASDFAWRRIRRVVPIFYMMALPWARLAWEWKSLSLPVVIATLFFWPAAGAETAYPVLFVGWTLAFEMLFYAAVAASLLVRRSWFFPALLAAFAACWALRLETGLPAFRFLGNPIILEFLLGVAIAHMAPHVSRRSGAAALALGLAGWAISLFVVDGGVADASLTASGALALQRAVAWGLPAGLIVLGAVALETPGAPSRTKRALVWLGDASYALYLVHPIVHFLIEKNFRDAHIQWSGDAVVVFGFGSALAAGALVYRYVERPLTALIPKSLPRLWRRDAALARNAA